MATAPLSWQYALIDKRVSDADERYGAFASTHEALGVALEEWDEFRLAIQQNDIDAIRHECFDLAAVLIRLASQLGNEWLQERSGL